MESKVVRPSVQNVKINDKFWSPYLHMIRCKFLSETFDKLENNHYFDGFTQVVEGIKGEHPYQPFSDGLVFETIRGASDFLAIEYDAELDARLDKYIELIKKAQDTVGDGFISTHTTCMFAERRWGENGGDIVIQHDLYNQGALVEAAVSHYLATKKTNLLEIAVKSANHICEYMGLPPKNNVIPGHALPEEAFIKLYRLFRDCKALESFKKEHNVNEKEYLRIVLFWLDNRGNRVDRNVSKLVTPYYYQDHLPFGEQTTAEGHSVRACLLYTAGVAAYFETGREDYRKAVNLIWQNIAKRKMHVNGGVGTRHDIEGFDKDYALPNDAYLETCASISLAFFSGEMQLLEKHAKYMDCFERSLCNNIIGAISADGGTFTYQNPLVMDGTFERKEWHNCPCCPPMLLKIFSALGSYIYSYCENEIFVNLYIDSKVEQDGFVLSQQNGKISLDTNGQNKKLCLRMPEYALDFSLLLNGKPVQYQTENGYAVISGVFEQKDQIDIQFSVSPRRVFANPLVKDDNGLVCVMLGAKLYCAEGFDNDGNVDFEIAKDPELKVEGQNIVGKTSDGKKFTLIPYYLWGNRVGSQDDKKMRVWFAQQDMPCEEQLAKTIKDDLYADYKW